MQWSKYDSSSFSLLMSITIEKRSDAVSFPSHAL